MGVLFDVLCRAADASTEKNWDEFAACYHEDVDAWAPTYTVHGRGELLRTIRQQNDPVDGIRLDMKLVVEAESTVVAEWVWSIPHPSGEGRASNHGLSYYVFDDGVIRTVRQYFDTASFLAELA
ncbi:MAG: nuclear transport factor 2 family protein [Acidimicrobiales bacterium]